MIRWIDWCMDHDSPITPGADHCDSHNWCVNKTRAVVIIDESN